MFKFKNNLFRKIGLLLSVAFTDSYSFAQEKYSPPQEEITWAKQFSGISGPGFAVEGEGLGGWRSRSDGVYYQGSRPRPEYNLKPFVSKDKIGEWYNKWEEVWKNRY